jgi:dynein light chain roadblock-type
MAANAPNEIEEVIKQLKSKPGFASYILMNNDGIVVKHENIEYKEAVMHAYHVLSLFGRTKKHLQKLLPDASENEIDWVRLRTKLHEMVIAQHLRFTLVVLQKPEAGDALLAVEGTSGVAVEGKDKEDDKTPAVAT